LAIQISHSWQRARICIQARGGRILRRKLLLKIVVRSFSHGFCRHWNSASYSKRYIIAIRAPKVSSSVYNQCVTYAKNKFIVCRWELQRRFNARFATIVAITHCLFLVHWVDWFLLKKKKRPEKVWKCENTYYWIASTWNVVLVLHLDEKTVTAFGKQIVANGKKEE